MTFGIIAGTVLKFIIFQTSVVRVLVILVSYGVLCLFVYRQSTV